jgi:hypothetical protein
LSGASIPFENNYLVNDLQIIIDSEIELNNTKKNSTTKKNVDSVSVDKSLLKLSVGDETVTLNESASRFSRKFKETLGVVSVGGDEDCPLWTFESKGTSPILLGAYVGQKIATMKSHMEACSIEVDFTIHAKDLVITHKVGLLANCLSLMRQKILRLIVLKRRPKMGNKYCLCQGKLATGKRHRGGVVVCL